MNTLNHNVVVFVNHSLTPLNYTDRNTTTYVFKPAAMKANNQDDDPYSYPYHTFGIKQQEFAPVEFD